MKDEIRNKLKIKRKYFFGIRREEADKVILESFLIRYGEYETFFIYNSFGTEASTRHIIEALKEMDKTIVYPKIVKDKMIAAFGEEFTRGAFGIDEPTGKEYKGKIDVSVVPLLAVNDEGYRVGYGKGYYDKFLKKRKCIKVGLGYDFQRDKFENDKWDIRLDAFLSEKGIYTYE